MLDTLCKMPGVSQAGCPRSGMQRVLSVFLEVQAENYLQIGDFQKRGKGKKGTNLEW